MSEKEAGEEEDGGKDHTSSTPGDVQGTKVLATQVGGHRYGKNGNKMGMLDRGNGIVLKALQTAPRGTRELSLYQTTFAPACHNRDLLELRRFLPVYHGTEVVDDVTFLVMNNITHSFSKPNVLDLKMGRVTYDPEASEEKKQHELTKYPPLKDLGFQLTGMMIHDAVSDCPMHITKDYCRSVTAENMLRDGLGKFFGLHNGRLRKDVIEALLTRLRCIEKWFQVQRTYAFYASSLLIVYGSQDPSRSASNPEKGLNLAAVPAMSDTKGSENRPAFQASSPPCQSSSLSPVEHQADEKSGRNVVNHMALRIASTPAADRPQKKSVFEGSGSSASKVKAGQKRAHTDQSEEEKSLLQSASLCKLARTQAAEENVEASEKGAGTSKNKVLGSSADKHGQENHALKNKQCRPESSSGLSECKESKAAEGEVCKTDCERGAASSVDKVTSDKGGCGNDPSLVEVRMIDFAHVFPASGKDDNYLFGLHRLIGFLEQLLKV